jgi:hypothetical protein
MVLSCLYLRIKFHMVWVTVLLMYPVTIFSTMCWVFNLCTLKWPFIQTLFVFKLPIYNVYVPLFHHTSCLICTCTHPIIIWYCKTICTCFHIALHRYLLLVLCASFAGYDTYWRRPWLSIKFKVMENKGQLSYATHKAVKNPKRKLRKSLMTN